MRRALALLTCVPACWTGETPTRATALEPVATPPIHRAVPRAQPPQQLEWPDRVRTELTDFVSAPIVRLDYAQAAVTTLCGDAALQAATEWQQQLASAKTAATCQASGPPWVMVCFLGSPDVLMIFFKDEEAPYLAAAVIGMPKTHSRALLAQWQQQAAAPVCP